MRSENWMFGDRLEITLKLSLDGNLHVGSGDAKPDAKLRAKPAERDAERDAEQDAEKDPEVSLVLRDKDGNAIIPATSLKGALRGQTSLDRDGLTCLLGCPGTAPEDALTGRLWLAAAVATAGDNRRFVGMTKNGGLRPQGFVKTAVSIDRCRGSADDKLLYNREMIGQGVVFTAKATLFLDGGDETALTDQLAELLAPLARDPGLFIGGQHRQAGGRLRLDEIGIVRRTIDPDSLDLMERPEPDLGRQILQQANRMPLGAVYRAIHLELTCEGPFISMRDESPERIGDSKVTEPLCQPDPEQEKRPLLWPSSLLGVLRARASWLAECDRLRCKKEESRFAPGRKPEAPMDNHRKAIVHRRDELKNLSSVERLFGVTGWRGLLSIASLEATADCPRATHKMTSVTIDRFTGGAMDDRLFTEEAFLGASFTAELRYQPRAEDHLDEARRGADKELLDLLLADIGKRGLELGHGAAKGFGWFTVAVRQGEGGGRS